jgi:FkbH-like protein
MNQAICGYFIERGAVADLWEADFDQIERQILDPTSELYEVKPEFVIIFPSTQKLLKKFYQANDKSGFGDKYIADINNLISTLENNLSAKILFLNFAETDDNVFGNFANKISSSFIYQLRKINLELMLLAQQKKNLFIVDVAALFNHFGKAQAVSSNIYINTGVIFSLDFLSVVAKNICDVTLAIKGKFKKALILDLDNTTWGGIIGDDGMENIQVGDLGIGKAFTELQRWAKQLKQRGVILAVCSKNDEKNAKEPFEKHPEMVLRLEDIAVFVANWENKVDNIRFIQSVLNIGFDSMVFLDDNPFERNMIRQAIPELYVPELPEDPADYLPYLQSLNLFETASLSAEDENRTQQYQEESKRTVLQKSYANEEEFLESLEMKATVTPFNKFNTPRVAQLSQRSNQFNLRTVRYSEEDIAKLADDPDYFTFAFSLKDKYGDYGLISLIILQRMNSDCFIETWLMSCRVLKRGMEQFVLNTIAEEVKQKGFSRLIGEYIPTNKNGMVKEFYSSLVFSPVDGSKWMLDATKHLPRRTIINLVKE